MTDRTTPARSPQVLVLGGGPAGLATASELALHGIRVVLVEPRLEVSHSRPRAKTTSPRTMEHFRRWGVADEVRARAPLSPSWNRRVVFCDRLDGSTITEFNDVFGLSAEPHDLFAESGQQVAQPVVEEVLRDHLAQIASVDVRLGHRAVVVEEQADAVVVTIEGPDGSNYRLPAEYVVGADGGWSVAREAVGAKLEGTSAPTANLNAVFRSKALRPVMGDALHYWVIGPAVPGAVGPLDRDGLWWAGLAGVGDQNDPAVAATLIADLAGVPEEDLDLEILSTDPWTPRMLLADRFSSDRVFLVGESAHLNPPFGGHGFNTCVGDAVNVGWKLAAVLNGWGTPALLRSYDVERRRVALETIESATNNMRASGRELARTAEALQRTKTEEFHSLGLTLGYTYAGSGVIAETAEPAHRSVSDYVPVTTPGSRLPHAWLEPGVALFDRLGNGLTLLHPASDAGSDIITRVQASARARGIPFTVIARDEPGPGASEVLLVRPDQHIAWRGSVLDEAELTEALDLATGRTPQTATLG